MRLNTRVHDRDVAGMRYVYPVVSRRARGVSVGVNLNPNKACNWRCIYCQVPGLTRGAGPEIDLERLRRELTDMFGALVQGDYMERHVPQESRRINDVAFSGDGESTTSKQFAEAVALVREVLESFELLGTIRVVLITNGSMIDRPEVQAGLRAMSSMNGEVWFKLDSATAQGRRVLNDTGLGTERVLDNLLLASKLCRTRIQTIALALDGRPPSPEEQAAYVALLNEARSQGAAIEDVLLYGLERTSHQPEAPRLAKLSVEQLETFADAIRSSGLTVTVHP
ncbi:MAG: radical SAM protein [bacterium]|nr:radical SAM protein [bacterium]